jgi:cytoskeletal protein CcmA (bactofilin family)
MIFKSKNKQQEAVRKEDTSDRGKPVRRSGPSIITEEVVLEGNLITSGEVQINGTLHGDIRAAGVVVDSQGSIHGEVVAEEVVVRGRIIGPIHAIHVHIYAGAHVEGDISHETISIENGAYVHGGVRRMEDPVELTTQAVDEQDLYLEQPRDLDQAPAFDPKPAAAVYENKPAGSFSIPPAPPFSAQGGFGAQPAASFEPTEKAEPVLDRPQPPAATAAPKPNDQESA